jgi:hypothetical protein
MTDMEGVARGAGHRRYEWRWFLSNYERQNGTRTSEICVTGIGPDRGIGQLGWEGHFPGVTCGAELRELRVIWTDIESRGSGSP